MRHPTYVLVLLATCTLAAACSQPTAATSDCLADPSHWLVIGDRNQIPLRPGEALHLAVLCRNARFPDETLTVPIAWSMQPPSAGKIDDGTGTFTLSPAAVPRTRVKIAADLTVEGKKRHVDVEVVVIDPAPQPWAGLWRETSRLTCTADGKAGPPDGTPADKAPLIRELELHEDGAFTVAWFPFERYKDYAGTFAVDRQTGAVTFTISGGNHVPADTDLTGTLKMEPGVGLLLHDVYLGAPNGFAPPRACGHHFGD